MRTLVDRLINDFHLAAAHGVLLAFAIVLVFIGTLAQVDEGSTTRRRAISASGSSSARFVRAQNPAPAARRLSDRHDAAAQPRRRAHLSFSTLDEKDRHPARHSGVILLLVGQLATDMLARESQIHFVEGQTKAYAESSRNTNWPSPPTPAPAAKRSSPSRAGCSPSGGEIQNEICRSRFASKVTGKTPSRRSARR
jgi:hypothetical protein